jgi:hypothetical protein
VGAEYRFQGALVAGAQSREECRVGRTIGDIFVGGWPREFQCHVPLSSNR